MREENKVHITLINDYLAAKKSIEEKYDTFSGIVTNDFNNGFDEFLEGKFLVDELNSINDKFNELDELREKMYNLTFTPGSLSEIEENSKIFVKKAKELEELIDKFIGYYEEYNLQGV